MLWLQQNLEKKWIVVWKGVGKKLTKTRVNLSNCAILKCFGAKDFFKKDDV
jgi:hypothetical protein